MDKTIADQAVEAYIRTTDLIVSFNWALRLGQQDDLPMTHFGVLHELKKYGRRNLSQLANQVSVAKQTMTDISNKLIKLGYAERVYDENNRRLILLQLTQAGHDYAEQHAKVFFSYMRDEVFSKLSDDQLIALRDASDTLFHLQDQTIIGEKYGTRSKQLSIKTE